MLIAEEIELLLKAEEKFQKINDYLAEAYKDFKEQLIEGGFDITTSFIPGFGGNIPVWEPFWETAKNIAEIRILFLNYKNLWDRSLQAKADRNFLNDKVDKSKKEAHSIEEEMRGLNCDL